MKCEKLQKFETENVLVHLFSPEFRNLKLTLPDKCLRVFTFHQLLPMDLSPYN
jgi:hypothetical protein